MAPNEAVLGIAGCRGWGLIGDGVRTTHHRLMRPDWRTSRAQGECPYWWNTRWNVPEWRFDGLTRSSPLTK
jgi:hypothetical protein